MRWLRRASLLLLVAFGLPIAYVSLSPIPDPEGEGPQHPYRSRHLLVNGVRLHVVEAGPNDGPLLLLLHGFPEFWYEWREQIPFFATRGFRVLVPDQRGYNLSDRPGDAAAYRLETLAADVVELIESANGPAFVVGHDWGAAVAWHLAQHRPEWVRSVVVLNVPHPAVMQRALRSNPRQLFRSWLMFFFQLPRFPERFLAFGNWRSLSDRLEDSSRPGTFTDDELALYRHAWSQPGAITGMLNWYRASFRFPHRYPDAKIQPPVLVVWGARDHVLGRELAQASIERCADGHLVYLESATHWVVHEEPQRVNQLILDFIQPDPRIR